MAPMKPKKKCPECGQAMRWETRTDEVEYKGHRRAFESPGWWCTSCDEAIFEGDQLQTAERAFIELRAAVEEVLLPEQVAHIREKLKISQREAGRLLGGGPRAFQKYESGAVPVSAPMNNLLVLLRNDPKRIEELRRAPQKIAASSGTKPMARGFRGGR